MAVLQRKVAGASQDDGRGVGGSSYHEAGFGERHERGFQGDYMAAVDLLKSRKGFSPDVEMRLARTQWQNPALKMGEKGGVAEAEKWLGEIGRPRAMMLHTGLQKIGDESLEQKELLEKRNDKKEAFSAKVNDIQKHKRAAERDRELTLLEKQKEMAAKDAREKEEKLRA